MTFVYFAYGSNMWAPQLESRCPSATVIGTGRLSEWAAVYDKPSVDGSAKLNIRPSASSEVEGVLYEIDDSERSALDAAEPRYDPIEVQVDGHTVVTYTWTGEAFTGPPYEWYLSMVVEGARSNGLEPPDASGKADPLAPDLRVAGSDQLSALQEVVTAALVESDGRYVPHPGELAWWVHHAVPQSNPAMFVQGDRGVLIVDDTSSEISVFTKPGVPRAGLIEWAQRRLDDAGEIGFVDDTDFELIAYLESEGYAPNYTEKNYEWDLTSIDVPEPDLPPGWTLRVVNGEDEADGRRAASHAAFESTMESDAHLDRYLRFMRSPVYDSENDLVAVTPEGTIAGFMIWWPDDSGIAQIEPFGTHPDFERRGVGRALAYFGLARMREAGMSLARVSTDESRDTTSFYEGVGFGDVGRVRWWAKRP